MLISQYSALGAVQLPAWSGRQLHMRRFDASAPVMPDGYEDYLRVVESLCERAGHSGIAYLTVDEKIVRAGQSQRRPGAHVDGTWIPDLFAHGQPSSGGHIQPGTGGHPQPTGGGHGQPSRPTQGHYQPDRGGGGHGQPNRPSRGHLHGADIPPQSIIVAASVPGCLVYPGTFDGTPMDDGDLEHIRPQLGDGLMLPAGQGFLLSPDCIHESVRFQADTKRTFLRIALEAGAETAEAGGEGRGAMSGIMIGSAP